MGDKAAARQYAARITKKINMRNPEYIPEPTGASNTSITQAHNKHTALVSTPS